MIIIRLNNSFHPLIFTKLRFLPPKKKKTTKPLLGFAIVAVLSLQRQFLVNKNKKITRGNSLRVPRRCRPSQNNNLLVVKYTITKFCSYKYHSL